MSYSPVIQQDLNLEPLSLFLVNLASGENFELIQWGDLRSKAENPSPFLNHSRPVGSVFQKSVSK